jgi:hypothetical protein
MSPVFLDLVPGQETSTGIVGTGTMPPSWEGGKYRITARTKLTMYEADETNNVKELEIDVPWAKLTDVLTIMLEGTKYKGECSASKNVEILKGKIAGNGYGVIKYQWIIDGVTDGTVHELTYYVDDILKEVGVITIPLQDRTGWGRIKIVSPGQKQSDTAVFTIACTGQGIDPGLIGKLNVNFNKWISLGKLSPAPQGCQGCTSTFNQISSIDQRSLSLVNEGQILTKKITGTANKLEKDNTARRLNEINSQLEANMSQRNGLLAQYNKQVADYNTKPRKPAPVRR